jgi:hypothetical protein
MSGVGTYERSLEGLMGLQAQEYWRNRAAMAEAHARKSYAEVDRHSQDARKARGDLEKARHRIGVLEAKVAKLEAAE